MMDLPEPLAPTQTVRVMLQWRFWIDDGSSLILFDVVQVMKMSQVRSQNSFADFVSRETESAKPIATYQ
jgi:hypothetical protein